MKEHHIRVSRTARYHTLGTPEEGDVRGAPRGKAPWSHRELWFVLHGYRQSAARFLRRFEGLDDGSRLIVAPEALSRFYVEREARRHDAGSVVGASWMTRDDREREIEDYVAYLDALASTLVGDIDDDIDTDAYPLPVTVLGFSQGAATAARWAVLGRRAPARLILWGEALPPDLPEEQAESRLATVRTVLVRGETDPTRLPEAESAGEAHLAAWSVPFEVRTHPGGHELDRGLLAELAGWGEDPADL